MNKSYFFVALLLIGGFTGCVDEVKDDDLFIYPNKEYVVKDSKIITKFDHRIAMAFCVMGSLLNKNLEISESECIKTSFPNFVKSFNSIGGNLIE